MKQMKGIIFTIILGIVLSRAASGAAVFFTRSQLIQHAEVIAIVVLEEPEDAKPAGGRQDPFASADEAMASGRTWTYSKQATMRIEKILKGEISDKAILYGQEYFICAQCKLSKGRFLAFLKKDGHLWAGVNWQLSLRPIRDNTVEWYVAEEQRSPMEFRNLDEVTTEVQAALNKQKSDLDADGDHGEAH